MSTFYDKKTRRQFLLTSAGGLFSLPFLPSLLTKKALANAMATGADKRLVLFRLFHAYDTAQYIDPMSATLPIGNLGAKYLKLSENMDNSGKKFMGKPFEHDIYQDLINQKLVTIVRGLDMIAQPGAHGNHWLSSVGNAMRSGESYLHFPSIDNVLAESKKVYPDSTAPQVTKVIRMGGSSFKRINPNDKTLASSNFQSVDGIGNAKRLYQTLFSQFDQSASNSSNNSGKNLKLLGIQNAFESYKKLSNSSKLSSVDKLKLEEHMELTRNFEKKLETQSSFTLSCSKPNELTESENYYQNMNLKEKFALELQLMAMAIKCNLTKVITIGSLYHPDDSVIPDLGKVVKGRNLHTIYHDSTESTAALSLEQGAMAYHAYKKWNYDLFAENFLKPLNIMEGETGRTFIDNSLISILSESGASNLSTKTFRNSGRIEIGHSSVDYQPIMFGSLGGYLSPDKYVSFPKRTPTYWGQGLPYNKLLITFLQGMGLSHDDYQFGTEPGFGVYDSSRGKRDAWGSEWAKPIEEIIA